MFLRVQPLSRTRSLSREYFCVPNVSVPVNRSRRLLGGSQHTSPEESTEKIRGKYYFSETWKLRRQTSWLCFIEVNFFLNSIVQKIFGKFAYFITLSRKRADISIAICAFYFLSANKTKWGFTVWRRDAGRMIRVGGVSDCLHALYSSDWLDFWYAPPHLALHEWNEYDHGGMWVYRHLLRV